MYSMYILWLFTLFIIVEILLIILLIVSLIKLYILSCLGNPEFMKDLTQDFIIDSDNLSQLIYVLAADGLLGLICSLTLFII